VALQHTQRLPAKRPKFVPQSASSLVGAVIAGEAKIFDCSTPQRKHAAEIPGGGLRKA
jgi:hypothetical protein